MGAVLGEIVGGQGLENLESQTHKFEFGVSKHRFLMCCERSRKLWLTVISKGLVAVSVTVSR